MSWKIFLLSFLFVACGNSNTIEADKFYKSVGGQIRKERIHQGLSQQALADSVGITQNALSLIEDGMATPIHTKLITIQDFLKVEFQIEGKHAKIEDYLKENKLN